MTKGERLAATHQPLSRSLRVYQRIAVGFVGITFLMLLAVVYLSVSRATITVTAHPKIVTATASVDVVADPLDEGQIAGMVRETTLEKSKVFTLPQEGARAVEAKAGGYVTLINNTNAAQPLVATTRLLSKEGTLFRIRDTTSVPAQGQVQVYAQADVVGASGNIGASSFTIPGLAASLQDKIYGVSTDAMTGGVQYIRTLTEQDIADATTTLQADLLASAKTSLSQGLDASLAEQGVYAIEVINKTTDVAVGTETGAFALTLKGDISAVYFDKNMVKAYAETLLRKRLPEGFALHALNTDGTQMTVESIDTQKGTAVVSVYLDGTAIISQDAPTLAKDRFLGRAPNEVYTLLQSSDAIENVSITFTPFWLKRMPTLSDHIDVVIEVPESGT